jgi:hypothetical protein
VKAKKHPNTFFTPDHEPLPLIYLVFSELFTSLIVGQHHHEQQATKMMELSSTIPSLFRTRWSQRIVLTIILILAVAVYLNTIAFLPSVLTLRGHEDEEFVLLSTNAIENPMSSLKVDAPNSPRSIDQVLRIKSTVDEPPPYYYYHYGRFQYQFDPELSDQGFQNGKVLYLLDHETPTLIGPARIRDLYDALPNKTQRQVRLATRTVPVATDTWVLPEPLRHPTRNHDTIILSTQQEQQHGDHDDDDNETIGKNGTTVFAIHLLGRHCRHVQRMDLATGQQRAVRTPNGTDPDGRPLDDLNHVSAVLVRNVETMKLEIWLPCGFHGDTVNGEVSSNYVRIVDVATLQVRSGPRLPESGGACVASSAVILPHEPPMVCVAGGTDGTHDRGRFIRQTYCYDRVRQIWHSPLGKLPYGLDHGSLAIIEPGVCHPDDPARWLILNFRTKPYGDAHSEILAFDWPENGWKIDDLLKAKSADEEKWYIFYNGTTQDDFTYPETVGRDASGIIVASRRHIVNFGGTYHYWTTSAVVGEKKKRKRGRFSMIRSFDVCTKQWSVIGDLGLKTFALQSAAMASNMALTCGGEAPMRHSNGHWCFLTRFHNGMELINRYPGPF